MRCQRLLQYAKLFFVDHLIIIFKYFANMYICMGVARVEQAFADIFRRPLHSVTHSAIHLEDNPVQQQFFGASQPAVVYVIIIIICTPPTRNNCTAMLSFNGNWPRETLFTAITHSAAAGRLGRNGNPIYSPPWQRQRGLRGPSEDRISTRPPPIKYLKC